MIPSRLRRKALAILGEKESRLPGLEPLDQPMVPGGRMGYSPEFAPAGAGIGAEMNLPALPEEPSVGASGAPTAPRPRFRAVGEKSLFGDPESFAGAQRALDRHFAGATASVLPAREILHQALNINEAARQLVEEPMGEFGRSLGEIASAIDSEQRPARLTPEAESMLREGTSARGHFGAPAFLPPQEVPLPPASLGWNFLGNVAEGLNPALAGQKLARDFYDPSTGQSNVVRAAGNFLREANRAVPLAQQVFGFSPEQVERGLPERRLHGASLLTRGAEFFFGDMPEDAGTVFRLIADAGVGAWDALLEGDQEKLRATLRAHNIPAEGADALTDAAGQLRGLPGVVDRLRGVADAAKVELQGFPAEPSHPDWKNLMPLPGVPQAPAAELQIPELASRADELAADEAERMRQLVRDEQELVRAGVKLPPPPEPDAAPPSLTPELQAAAEEARAAEWARPPSGVAKPGARLRGMSSFEEGKVRSPIPEMDASAQGRPGILEPMLEETIESRLPPRPKEMLVPRAGRAIDGELGANRYWESQFQEAILDGYGLDDPLPEGAFGRPSLRESIEDIWGPGSAQPVYDWMKQANRIRGEQYARMAPDFLRWEEAKHIPGPGGVMPDFREIARAAMSDLRQKLQRPTTNLKDTPYYEGEEGDLPPWEVAVGAARDRALEVAEQEAEGRFQDTLRGYFLQPQERAHLNRALQEAIGREDAARRESLKPITAEDVVRYLGGEKWVDQFFHDNPKRVGEVSSQAINPASNNFWGKMAERAKELKPSGGLARAIAEYEAQPKSPEAREGLFRAVVRYTETVPEAEAQADDAAPQDPIPDIEFVPDDQKPWEGIPYRDIFRPPPEADPVSDAVRGVWGDPVPPWADQLTREYVAKTGLQDPRVAAERIRDRAAGVFAPRKRPGSGAGEDLAKLVGLQEGASKAKLRETSPGLPRMKGLESSGFAEGLDVMDTRPKREIEVSKEDQEAARAEILKHTMDPETLKREAAAAGKDLRTWKILKSRYLAGIKGVSPHTDPGRLPEGETPLRDGYILEEAAQAASSGPERAIALQRVLDEPIEEPDPIQATASNIGMQASDSMSAIEEAFGPPAEPAAPEPPPLPAELDVDQALPPVKSAGGGGGPPGRFPLEPQGVGPDIGKGRGWIRNLLDLIDPNRRISNEKAPQDIAEGFALQEESSARAHNLSHKYIANLNGILGDTQNDPKKMEQTGHLLEVFDGQHRRFLDPAELEDPNSEISRGLLGEDAGTRKMWKRVESFLRKPETAEALADKDLREAAEKIRSEIMDPVFRQTMDPKERESEKYRRFYFPLMLPDIAYPFVKTHLEPTHENVDRHLMPREGSMVVEERDAFRALTRYIRSRFANSGSGISDRLSDLKKVLEEGHAPFEDVPMPPVTLEGMELPVQPAKVFIGPNVWKRELMRMWDRVEDDGVRLKAKLPVLYRVHRNLAERMSGNDPSGVFAGLDRLVAFGARAWEARFGAGPEAAQAVEDAHERLVGLDDKARTASEKFDLQQARVDELRKKFDEARFGEDAEALPVRERDLQEGIGILSALKVARDKAFVDYQRGLVDMRSALDEAPRVKATFEALTPKPSRWLASTIDSNMTFALLGGKYAEGTADQLYQAFVDVSVAAGRPSFRPETMGKMLEVMRAGREWARWGDAAATRVAESLLKSGQDPSGVLPDWWDDVIPAVIQDFWGEIRTQEDSAPSKFMKGERVVRDALMAPYTYFDPLVRIWSALVGSELFDERVEGALDSGGIEDLANGLPQLAGAAKNKVKAYITQAKRSSGGARKAALKAAKVTYLKRVFVPEMSAVYGMFGEAPLVSSGAPMVSWLNKFTTFTRNKLGMVARWADEGKWGKVLMNFGGSAAFASLYVLAGALAVTALAPVRGEEDEDKGLSIHEKATRRLGSALSRFGGLTNLLSSFGAEVLVAGTEIPEVAMVGAKKLAKEAGADVTISPGEKMRTGRAMNALLDMTLPHYKVTKRVWELVSARQRTAGGRAKAASRAAVQTVRQKRPTRKTR